MAITYTPTTNFGAKDTLPTNDPDKVIKGTEFTTEFTAIQTAFGQAAPAASPTFTGTVTIPTVDINGGSIDGTAIGANSASTGAFTILAADNAEIGTGGASNANAIIDLTGDTTYTDFGFRIIRNSGANGRTDLRHRGTGNLTIEAVEAAAITFETSDTERMRIDSAGNVGIGTSSPSSFGGYTTLSINNATNGGIVNILVNGTETARMQAFSGAFALAAKGASTEMTFETNAAERMRIDSSGNVGIGASSPNALLNVQKADVSGFSPNTSFDLAVLENGTSATGAVLQIVAATDGSSEVGFSDSTRNAGLISYVHTSDSMIFVTATSEAMRIDSSGNLLLAGTGTPTSSAGNFVLYNGTAPTGSATDGVILYAEDVSASSELKVRDEAGNVTTLSPHNFDLIPEGPSEDMAWSYYSERDGKRINVDMLKAIRVLEQLSGEKLVHMV